MDKKVQPHYISDKWNIISLKKETIPLIHEKMEINNNHADKFETTIKFFLANYTTKTYKKLHSLKGGRFENLSNSRL